MENNILYMITFSGEILGSWEITTGVGAQKLLSTKQKTISYYNWSSYDESLYGNEKYYFIKQTIDLEKVWSTNYIDSNNYKL